MFIFYTTKDCDNGNLSSLHTLKIRRIKDNWKPQVSDINE